MIKKVTMYVDVNDDKLLQDEYYREEFESLIKEGKTETEAMADIAEHYLELEMGFIFQGREVINHHTVDVIITSRDRISKLDTYAGYMELTDGNDVMVYNVDGILMGYVA